MSWNYRLMRRTFGGEVRYEIHEAYYDEEGNVNGWTEDAVQPISESQGGILLVLAQMVEAISQPVLDAETGRQVEEGMVLTDNLTHQLSKVMTEFDGGDLEPATTGIDAEERG